MTEAYIIDAVRTPRGIGKVGKGALTHLHPQHLAATVLKALQVRNDIDTAEVDDIVWGTSAQKGKQGGDMARMAALDAGFDVRASGVTLDRFCGSGLTAVSMAAAQIRSGMEDQVIAGGTEMMSYITSSGQEEMAAGLKSLGIGSGNKRLQQRHPQSHQGLCADAIASMEHIGREALDAFSLESQQRAGARDQGGTFREIAWFPSSMRTARSRSPETSILAPRPPRRIWPLSSRASRKWRTFLPMGAASRFASSSTGAIPT